MIFDDQPESSADTRETSQIWLRLIWVICGSVCLIGLIVWLTNRHSARQTRSPSTVALSSTNSAQVGHGHFDLADDLLKNMDGMEVDLAADRIVFHLQKWADGQKAADNWLADPLFNQLPKRLGYSGKQNLISRLTFGTPDIYSLREAYWLRDLSKRIAHEGVLDAATEEWLEASAAEEGGEVVGQLRVVMRLFDWVVRNIQLEPDGLAEATKDFKQPFPNGAQRTSWEALLIGRGHAWVRAQILMLLARQQRIDVVVLGIQSSEGSSEPRPWTTAAYLDGKLFLLDTRLGLPIPAKPNGQGIATLADVVGDPALLRSLDIQGSAYPVVEDDLDSVVALLHATPDYLSQRMKLIEPRLVGAAKTVLTTEPSRLRQALLKHDSIGRVSLWTMPYDAIRYQTMIFRNPKATQKRMETMFAVEGDRPLAMGRRRLFQGILDDDLPTIGAKSYLMECRIADRDMPDASAAVVVGLVENAGAEVNELPKEQLQSLQQEALRQMVRSKRAATYWLALMNFDAAKYQVTLDYLEKRVLPMDKGAWLEGAHYNLGRTYERMAAAANDNESRLEMLEKARQHYLESRQSPQAAGNQLRAQRVAEQISQSQ